MYYVYIFLIISTVIYELCIHKSRPKTISSDNLADWLFNDNRNYNRLQKERKNEG